MIDYTDEKACAEYYRKLGQKAYDDYQSTGENKYYRRYEQYESIEDAYRRAGSTAEDRQRAGNLISAIIGIADKCDSALHSMDGDTEAACRNAVAVAEVYGYDSRWK